MDQLNEINFIKLNKLSCHICGGKTVINGECYHCMNKDDEVEQETNKLLTILTNNMNNNISLDLDSVNFFIEINKLNNIEEVRKNYPIIPSFINEQHLNSKIEGFFNTLIFKFNKNEKITQNEELLLTELFKGRIYSNKIINSIMIETLTKNKVIDYKTFEEYIKCFVTSVAIEIINELDFDMNNIFQKNEYNQQIEICKNLCTIEEEKDKNTAGSIIDLFHIINITPEIIKNIYDGNFYDLKTVFHELIHFKQFRMIDNEQYSPTLQKIIKEKIIQEINQEYYQKNYIKISYETNARANAFVYLLRYLDSLGLEISKTVKNYIIEQIDEEIEIHKDQLRFYQEDESSINDIFDKVVEDHPEYLGRYIQLRLEYKEEDGKVIPKTLDELIGTYKCIIGDEKKQILYDRIIETKEKKEKISVDQIEEKKVLL